MNTDLPHNLRRERALKRLGSFFLLAGIIAIVIAPLIIANFSEAGIATRDQYASIGLAAIFFVAFFIAVNNRKTVRKRLPKEE